MIHSFIHNMDHIILSIDTTSREKIIVKLTIDGNEFIKEEEVVSRKNQAVLPMIIQLLKDHTIQLQDITAIEVNPGPGSFTGIRVGVAVANALSYILKIPVNGNLIENGTSLVEPVYAA